MGTARSPNLQAPSWLRRRGSSQRYLEHRHWRTSTSRSLFMERQQGSRAPDHVPFLRPLRFLVRVIIATPGSRIDQNWLPFPRRLSFLHTLLRPCSNGCTGFNRREQIVARGLTCLLDQDDFLGTQQLLRNDDAPKGISGGCSSISNYMRVPEALSHELGISSSR